MKYGFGKECWKDKVNAGKLRVRKPSVGLKSLRFLARTITWGGAVFRGCQFKYGLDHYQILWGSFDSKFDWKCHIANLVKHSKKIGFNKNLLFEQISPRLGLWSRTLTPLQNLQSFPKENKNSQR